MKLPYDVHTKMLLRPPGQDCSVELDAFLAAAIELLKDGKAGATSPYVFPGADGRPLTDIKRTWLTVCREAGLEPMPEAGGAGGVAAEVGDVGRDRALADLDRGAVEADVRDVVLRAPVRASWACVSFGRRWPLRSRLRQQQPVARSVPHPHRERRLDQLSRSCC